MPAEAIRRAGRRAVLVLGVGAVWVARLLAFVLLFVPLGVMAWMSFGAASISVIPPATYSLHWYVQVFHAQDLDDALVLSLEIAALVVPTSVALGVAAGYGQWRWKALPSRLVELALSLPILVPVVVTGLALLYAFAGLDMYSAFWNIVLAHVIITLPFTVRFTLTSLARYDRQLDEAAAILGAPPWRTFWWVTLPLLRPAIFASAIITFAVSFDDFGVTIFLIDPGTVTLPIAMYQYWQWNLDPTLAAMSSMLVVVAAVLTLLCDWTIGLDRFTGARQ